MEDKNGALFRRQVIQGLADVGFGFHLFIDLLQVAGRVRQNQAFVLLIQRHPLPGAAGGADGQIGNDL